MSFWYDLKQKAYSTDRNNSWLKAYVDRIVGLLRKESADTFETHFSGSSNRHLAKDIDTNGGNTVEEALELEKTTRAEVDESTLQKLTQETAERTSADANLSQLISTETTERLSADATLTQRIATETANRKTADQAIGVMISEIRSAQPTQVPSLAAACADGTPIGSDTWTGTGFFCRSNGSRYSLITEITSISDFNRFCLRPVDTVPRWKNWTPYFDYNGTSYEFFYSDVRGVYETLIPPVDMTAEAVVAAIRWEFHPPTLLNYGKISNLLGFHEADNLISVKPEAFFRNSAGYVEKIDYTLFINLCLMNSYTLAETSIAIADMDIVRGSIFALTVDVNMDAQPSSSDNVIAVTLAYEQLAPMPVETCDNF